MNKLSLGREEDVDVLIGYYLIVKLIHLFLVPNSSNNLKISIV